MPERDLTRFGDRTTAAEVVDGLDLTGRTAIVTGGASGIGVETARALAGAGARVTLAVRDVDAGRRVADDIARIDGGGSTGRRRTAPGPSGLRRGLHRSVVGAARRARRQRGHHGRARVVHARRVGVAVRDQPPRALRPRARAARRTGGLGFGADRLGVVERTRRFAGRVRRPVLPPTSLRARARVRAVEDRQRAVRRRCRPTVGRRRHHRERPDARRDLDRAAEALGPGGPGRHEDRRGRRREVPGAGSRDLGPARHRTRTRRASRVATSRTATKQRWWSGSRTACTACCPGRSTRTRPTGCGTCPSPCSTPRRGPAADRGCAGVG